jgi:hypothetical protein
VAGIQVNDGTAQRSEVRSIAVTFSGPVTFAGGDANAAAAFQLNHVQTGGNVMLSAAVATDAQGRTVVTLGFAGAETDPVSGLNGGAPSLADGRYQLTILSANVTGSGGAALAGGGPDGDYVSPADTLGGGPGELALFRLFGDATGNGIVDQLDLAQFRAANNSSVGNPAYVDFLDADNSGIIDQIDLGQFRARNNASVFPTTPGATPHMAPTPPPSLTRTAVPAPVGAWAPITALVPWARSVLRSTTPALVPDENRQPLASLSIAVSSAEPLESRSRTALQGERITLAKQ